VGEIIDEEEANRRLEACKAAGEAHYYLMEIDADTIIDARHKVRGGRRLAIDEAVAGVLEVWPEIGAQYVEWIHSDGGGHV
jgi:hypothetical protein